jgi:hypothetical protein
MDVSQVLAAFTVRAIAPPPQSVTTKVHGDTSQNTAMKWTETTVRIVTLSSSMPSSSSSFLLPHSSAPSSSFFFTILLNALFFFFYIFFSLIILAIIVHLLLLPHVSLSPPPTYSICFQGQ